MKIKRKDENPAVIIHFNKDQWSVGTMIADRPVLLRRSGGDLLCYTLTMPPNPPKTPKPKITPEASEKVKTGYYLLGIVAILGALVLYIVRSEIKSELQPIREQLSKHSTQLETLLSDFREIRQSILRLKLQDLGNRLDKGNVSDSAVKEIATDLVEARKNRLVVDAAFVAPVASALITRTAGQKLDRPMFANAIQ